MFEDLSHLLKTVNLSWRHFESSKQDVGTINAFLTVITNFLGQCDAESIVKQQVPAGTSPQIEECFHAFCEGIEYVHQKYGTKPNAIILSNEDSDTPRYNIKSGNVYVPYRFLEALVGLGAIKQSKTGNELLSPAAAATMYGVEEAFHHFQFSRHYEKYAHHITTLPDPNELHGYDDNLIEADAKKEVQEALTAFRKLRPQQFSAISIPGLNKPLPKER